MKIPLVKPIFRMVALALSLVVYLLTIIAAFGGKFNPDFFTWPAIMVLLLPYLAILTVVITIAWFACGKLLGGSLGVLTLLLCWGALTDACPVNFTKSKPSGDPQFKLMSYNIIHGWDMEKKDSTANRTIEYIINSGVDIVCLQELIYLDEKEVPQFTADQQKRIKQVYPYRAGDQDNDLTVLSKYPVKLLDSREFIDGDFDHMRYSFYELSINGKPLTLVNMHFRSYYMTSNDYHNLATADVKEGMELLRGPLHQKLGAGFKKRKKDAQILREAIDKVKGPLIICGDFNDVPASYAYKLLRGDDLKDAYAETGFGPLITYNRHYFWFHLDQVFYRGPLKALEFHKGHRKGSDHFPIVVTFEME